MEHVDINLALPNVRFYEGFLYVVAAMIYEWAESAGVFIFLDSQTRCDSPPGLQFVVLLL